MNAVSHRLPVLVLATGLMLACGPAAAQQSQVVGGLVVNMGLVPAEVALRADGHREAHQAHPPAGSQHLLITLDTVDRHARVGDADVLVEIVGPRGNVERKHMLHTQGGGLADYSELFDFEWSGAYRIHAVITPARGGKPVESRFVVHHVI